MQIKNGVKIFIKNEKLKKFLFFLRDNKPTIPNPNTYGCLGGGIEKGEKPIDALRREIQEESNIQLYNLKELGNRIVSHTTIDKGIEKEVKSEVFYFLAQTNDLLKDLKLYEGQKLEYFTIKEALKKSNLAPPIRYAIEEFKKELI